MRSSNYSPFLIIPVVVLYSFTIFFSPLVGLTAASSISSTVNLPQAGNLVFQPVNQIVIRINNNFLGNAESPRSLIESINNAVGFQLSYLRDLSEGYKILRLPYWMPEEQVRKILYELAELPEVISAEPDLRVLPAFIPNDTYKDYQWNLFDSTGGINVASAWDITRGSSDLVVAIVDTGVVNHEDLAARLPGGSAATAGYDFIADDYVAQDADPGRDSDPTDMGNWVSEEEVAPGGYFYGSGCPVQFSNWHGTAVAGIIGGASNNNLGLAGINWQSRMLIARVLGKCGGNITDVGDAIRWSAGLHVNGVPDNPTPAKVINLSIYAYGSCPTYLQQAITAARDAGSLLIAVAGNNDTDVSNYTPANCNGVITVTGTDPAGDRAIFCSGWASNTGSIVDISAPSGSATDPDDPVCPFGDNSDGVPVMVDAGGTIPLGVSSYALIFGTSLATPHVSGVASLMLSINPSLTPSQVEAILLGTVRPFPTGSTCNTTICGSGIVDAYNAVNAARSPGDFSKLEPGEGIVDQPTSLDLAWESSTRAIRYYYCLDTSNNNQCDSSWENVGLNTSVRVTGLLKNITYYWQVKSSNSWVETAANGNAWWSFATNNQQLEHQCYLPLIKR